jgi:Asp-tRNA(Asn)/Glu-tRNA(Gln) amidotransferase A subunit family amidase
LKDHLLKQIFTSVDLVNVFGKRCYTIGRRLNLTAEEDFEYALKEAQIKDKERLEAIRNGTTHELPPFHGIPISVKDIVIFITLQHSIV